MIRQWAILGAAALLAFGLSGCRETDEKAHPVRAYIVHHVTAVARNTLLPDFEDETGIKVDATFACRADLLQIVSKNHDGDLYVDASLANLEQTKKDGLGTGDIVTIAELVPVIEVMTGNPKGVGSPADLAKPGVRVCLGLAKGCMGIVAGQILTNYGVADKVAPNIVDRVGGEPNVVNSVNGVKVDAAIVWASSVHELNRGDVEVVAIPTEKNAIDAIGLLVLNTGKNAKGAQRLAAYLQSPKAQKAFAEARLKR